MWVLVIRDGRLSFGKFCGFAVFEQLNEKVLSLPGPLSLYPRHCSPELCLQEAHLRGTQSAGLGTTDPHPMQTFSPHQGPPLLAAAPQIPQLHRPPHPLLPLLHRCRQDRGRRGSTGASWARGCSADLCDEVRSDSQGFAPPPPPPPSADVQVGSAGSAAGHTTLYWWTLELVAGWWSEWLPLWHLDARAEETAQTGSRGGAAHPGGQSMALSVPGPLCGRDSAGTQAAGPDPVLPR